MNSRLRDFDRTEFGPLFPDDGLDMELCQPGNSLPAAVEWLERSCAQEIGGFVGIPAGAEKLLSSSSLSTFVVSWCGLKTGISLSESFSPFSVLLSFFSQLWSSSSSSP